MVNFVWGVNFSFWCVCLFHIWTFFVKILKCLFKYIFNPYTLSAPICAMFPKWWWERLPSDFLMVTLLPMVTYPCIYFAFIFSQLRYKVHFWRSTWVNNIYVSVLNFCEIKSFRYICYECLFYDNYGKEMSDKKIIGQEYHQIIKLLLYSIWRNENYFKENITVRVTALRGIS